MSRIKTLFGVLMLLAVLVEAAGTITPKNPVILEGCYQITNKEELYGFAAIVNGSENVAPKQTVCARLNNNIQVNKDVLTPEGELNVADTSEFVPWTPIMNFQGTFNGQGFTISGLYFNDFTRVNVGFFSNIVSEENDREVSVKNLGIFNSYLRGGTSVGAIVGNVYAAGKAPVIIYNVRCHSRIEAKGTVAGGIVAHATGNVQIGNSVNTGYVAAKRVVGGIVGLLSGAPATVTNAFSVGVVESFNEIEENSIVGGIVGQAGGELELKNVYNQGYVVGSTVMGGIAGSLSGSSVLLVNAYDAGIMYSLGDEAEYTGAILGRYEDNAENFTYANVYYQKGAFGDIYGVEVPKEMMSNGTIAYLLHNYYYEGLNTSIWGQVIGEDPAPDFSGSITGVLPEVFEKLSLHTYEGDASVLPEEYVPGYRFDLPAVTREGYSFYGWYDNAEFKGNPIKFIPATASGEQEFWARYTPIYNISYQTGSGVVNIDKEVLSYVEGVGVVLPKNVTRSGAIFRGWYKDKNFEGERLYEIDSKESGDVVLYAKWLEKKEPSKSSDGCYVIKDVSDLYGFAAIVNGTDGFSMNQASCAYLANDIVVNENVLNQDGSLNVADSAGFVHWVPIIRFGGKFDGRGHSISGLYVKCDSVRNYSEAYSGYGFFGSVGVLGSKNSPVIVKNVGIEASYFETKGNIDNVGALIGTAVGAPTTYSYVKISNCYNTSTVNAVRYPGGIVGVIDTYSNTVIENCYNTGSIEGKNNYAGGLVGAIRYDAIVNISNCYNVGRVVSYGTQKDNDALVGEVKSIVDVTNSYYLNVSGVKASYGSAAEMEQFENGDVAYALHNAENGFIWGQNVGVDPLPNFSGEIKNYISEETSSSSVMESSSSSAVKSSSSQAKSSSSVKAKSSSSAKAKSSSSVAKSSSSAKVKSSSSQAKSSSSAKAKSSSSGAVKSSSSRKGFVLYCNGEKCSEAVLETWETPRFDVTVAGRNVLVTGARNGSPYAVLDIQGQVLASGRVDGFLSIEVPRSGNFLVRVDRQIRRISVK
jgi:uncharacterized repeat protein (TIGR02543 family)